MIKQKWRIPPMLGLGFKLEKGQVVRITDVMGEQIADFVAYRTDDTSVRLDPGVTKKNQYGLMRPILVFFQ
ncbi:DUF1989 domain-containing protein [Paenibacillus sp. Soil787]|uniref:DUF1989 domain-containing protein n=1 Tax=Paenibacillus sp. Soil787 TaxID=1736411 RepID=UPI000702C81E|nr:DUF1989 domain-containing protein [Paenibacillus sp. Soil787]KRF17612.1 hypothetical protein ASG93_33295 [Paenibacillus sp. Soil787]